MSDEEKNFTPDALPDSSDTVKASEMDEKEASKKLAKAAKGTKAKKAKDGRGNAVKRFFKDFRGESKKVVWPDAKTVLKSTGVVLLAVVVSAVAIFGIDWCLTTGVKALKGLASDEETTVAEVVDGEETTDGEAAEDETKAEDETEAGDEKETEKAEKAEEDTTAAEETDAEETFADDAQAE